MSQNKKKFFGKHKDEQEQDLEQTQPLIDFYKDKGVLYTVDGEGDMNDISKKVLEHLRDI